MQSAEAWGDCNKTDGSGLTQVFHCSRVIAGLQANPKGPGIAPSVSITEQLGSFPPQMTSPTC